MALQEYRRKRNFSKTPEPAGKKSAKDSHSFVVQKHAASRLHYDFRLELDGVLKSWAVPKGPSMTLGEKRLAVEVEDHPLEYGSFEGTIPQGEYGGGTVIVWDRGSWAPEGDARGSLRKGQLKFDLDGERLKGRFALIRMKPRSDAEESKPNWLLIKEKEGASRAKGEVTDRHTTSVISGRTIDQVATAKRGKVWSSNRRKDETPSAKRAAPAKKKASAPSTSSRKKSAPAARAKQKKKVGDPAAVPGAKRGRFPEGVAPQLCTLTTEVPSGAEWIHEIKLDGYRILAALKQGKVQLFTRKGLDWTDKFAGIAASLTELPVDSALLDGEVVALDEEGKSSFQGLQGALKGGSVELSYCVFDLLYLDGYDLRGAALSDRKAVLEQLLPKGIRGAVYYSDHIEGNGEKFFESACALGLEGIVCKDRTAPYQSRRTRGWLKVRCGAEQELVIVGFSMLRVGGVESNVDGVGALHLGYYDRDGALRYAGKVGTGFNTSDRAELYRKLAKLERKDSPVSSPVKVRGARWVRPTLVAQIKFTEWTADGRLRHPVFHGLRADKPAREVVREVPAATGDEGEIELEEQSGEGEVQAVAKKANSRGTGKASSRSSAKKASRSTSSPSSASSSGRVEVGGVDVSHPERVIDPQSGLTKLDLVEYYEKIADRMLPYIEGRAIVMVRFPAGVEGERFFQKHANDTFPDDFPRVKLKESSGIVPYVTVHTPAHLLQLVQFNAIELHIFGFPFDRAHADQMVFDLDPGPDVGWPKVIAGAKRIRELLAEADLESFVKVSGGKGLHIVVPLRNGPAIEGVAELSRLIAQKIAGDEPEAYTATMSKAKRAGRIFIDYLRNSPSGTSVAPYSVRGRPGLPISMPISWDQLKVSPTAFTIANIDKKLPSRAADPWKDFFKVRQSLTAPRIKKLEKLLQD